LKAGSGKHARCLAVRAGEAQRHLSIPEKGAARKEAPLKQRPLSRRQCGATEKKGCSDKTGGWVTIAAGQSPARMTCEAGPMSADSVASNSAGMSDPPCQGELVICVVLRCGSSVERHQTLRDSFMSGETAEKSVKAL